MTKTKKVLLAIMTAMMLYAVGNIGYKFVARRVTQVYLDERIDCLNRVTFNSMEFMAKMCRFYFRRPGCQMPHHWGKAYLNLEMQTCMYKKGLK